MTTDPSAGQEPSLAERARRIDPTRPMPPPNLAKLGLWARHLDRGSAASAQPLGAEPSTDDLLHTLDEARMFFGKRLTSLRPVPTDGMPCINHHRERTTFQGPAVSFTWKRKLRGSCQEQFAQLLEDTGKFWCFTLVSPERPSASNRATLVAAPQVRALQLTPDPGLIISPIEQATHDDMIMTMYPLCKEYVLRPSSFRRLRGVVGL